MKILIIGGTGFLGSAVHAALLLRMEQRTDISSISVRSRSNGLDLLDMSSVCYALMTTKPDIIFNCAAVVGSLHHIKSHHAEIFATNVQMMLNLYEGIRIECPEALVINPISNCAYPGGTTLQIEKDWLNGPVHESVMSYGNSKRALHTFSCCYNLQYGIRSKNVILPNMFGPGDSTDVNKVHALSGMIIRMLQAHRAKELFFTIYGTGTPVREWGYVHDMAQALVMIAVSQASHLMYPINVAQGCGHSIGSSAKEIARLIGYEGELRFDTSYADGDLIKVLDDTQFRSMYPQFLFTGHVDGLEKTIEYYRRAL